MSLRFELSKIGNPEDLGIRDGAPLPPKTWALIQATMFVQLGAIVPANVDEFVRRLDLWQHGVDAFLRSNAVETLGAPVYLTREDVLAHIGLTTNVVSEPARKWDRYFRDVLVGQVEDKIRLTPRMEAELLQQA